MSYIYPHYNLIYLKINKAGLTSIQTALNPDLPAKKVARSPHIKKRNLPFEKVKDYPEMFTFSFVRNPWDRLVSCWADKCQRPKAYRKAFYVRGIHHKMSFEKFVDCVIKIPHNKCNSHYRPQYLGLYYDEDKLPEFIGRVERFEDDWRVIQDYVRITTGKELAGIPHTRKSSHKRYTDHYTEDLIEKVAEYYKKDIELLNYKFGE